MKIPGYGYMILKIEILFITFGKNNDVTTMPKPENIKNKGFDKHPENINRKGAPKKVLRTLMETLKKEYGEPISKTESKDLLIYIETLPVHKLTDFVKDEKIPAIVQAYARLLLTGEQKDLRRVNAAELIKDRNHGKAKQAIDLSNEDKSMTPTVIILPNNDRD
jgi:hypothetical protein